jgi:tRNA modification GTPase
MEDTIAAISTPIGVGGIAIIRLSGPRALQIADEMFFSKAGKPSGFPTHTIHFGRISNNGNCVDQVMLSVMRAPRSYTAEDIVEINCHGGPLTTRRVLALCLDMGARLAEPGEFTKRAFLNGRLDLAQAEAVMDLITAKTKRAHKAAEHALEGHLSRRIGDVRDQLLGVVAHMEAHIDFPEEDIDTGTRDHWLGEIMTVTAFLRKLLATAADGKVLRHGIAVTIVGRPNAGKSSLMNALLGEDRAIVTPVPGTTRDTIEEFTNLRGVPVKLTDTAGIRKARGTVERAGIARSRKCLSRSDLVLHLFDGSRSFSIEDRRLFTLCEGLKVIQVTNKADLPQRLRIPAECQKARSVVVSVKTGDGLEELKDLIESTVFSMRFTSSDFDLVVNERQADALQRAFNSLTTCTDELRDGAACEIVSQQMRVGLNAIGEIVGSTTTEDILDRIFSSFCVGK